MAERNSDESSDTIDYEHSRGYDVEIEERHADAQGVRGRGRGRGRRGRSRGPRARGERGRGMRRGRESSRRSSGRSRGPRRRGGRGTSDRIARDDRARVQERRENRKRETQELIRNVPEETLRQIVLQLVERGPGLVFDLCEAAVAPPGEIDEGPPEEPTEGPSQSAPSWCKCSNCREMPTDLERKCCDCLPQNCVSRKLEMDTLVLDPAVLALGNGYHRDMLGRYGEPVEDYHRSMRHSAYRNFTLWRHGRLGQGMRRVIPSCCVWRVRTVFPDNTNTYTGFLPNRLA